MCCVRLRARELSVRVLVFGVRARVLSCCFLTHLYGSLLLSVAAFCSLRCALLLSIRCCRHSLVSTRTWHDVDWLYPDMTCLDFVMNGRIWTVV